MTTVFHCLTYDQFSENKGRTIRGGVLSYGGPPYIEHVIFITIQIHLCYFVGVALDPTDFLL